MFSGRGIETIALDTLVSDSRFSRDPCIYRFFSDIKPTSVIYSSCIALIYDYIKIEPIGMEILETEGYTLSFELQPFDLF